MRRIRGRRLAAVIVGVCLIPLAFLAPAQAAPTTVNGTNTGDVPDGIGDVEANTVPFFGPPRDVLFNVSGLTGSIAEVTVSITINHSWIGDLDVRLIAPGGSPEFVIFSRTGATSDDAENDGLLAYGFPSDLTGTYVFDDDATAHLWDEARSFDDDEGKVVPAGTYRTTAAGGAGESDPALVTNLSGAFAGVNPNGTWTLRFRDGAVGDEGTVTAASLTLDVIAGGDGDGDGVSDNIDECPSTPNNDPVGPDGCAPDPNDGDADDVTNNTDSCPNTPVNETPRPNGCSASQYRPDATIKKSPSGAVVGDGIRNADASGQVVQVRVRRGKSVTFEIAVQNDPDSAPVTDSYSVEGCRSSRGFKVSYSNGVSDITGDVIRGVHSVGPLNHLQSASIFLRIKVKLTGPRNKICRVRITSQGSPGISEDTTSGNAKARG